MNEATLKSVVDEILPILRGRPFGKIFTLSKLSIAIDFRLKDGSYLFVSVEPVLPRIYLIKRRLRDLEKQTINPHPFFLHLRKKLSNAIVQDVVKDENDRIVFLKLSAIDEISGPKSYSLVIQLTGRSANLFLLDDQDFIIDCLRENHGDGQIPGTRFSSPVRVKQATGRSDDTFPKGDAKTLSEALDLHYQKADATRLFQSQVKAVETRLQQEISKRQKLSSKLRADLADHGDAEHWKRLGDLLLANLANAVRVDQMVLVTDYFDENTPTIEVEVSENLSLTEAAEKFFKRYAKSRNAGLEIRKRLESLEFELNKLYLEKAELERAVAAKDLSAYVKPKAENKPLKAKEKRDDSFKGVRRYLSSDGLEILVGKASKDNDHLTFRIAKSLDFWLHAADYGGSHVLVRNPNRSPEIPQKTLLEAAQLAAYFSQAREQPKAAVNYTQKKFVNKPKGAAPGLVSLSSFRTVLVVPKPNLQRTDMPDQKTAHP